VRVAAMRAWTKNGNAPEFSGRLEPSAGGCRLEGVIRMSVWARIVVTAMFAVPAWVLIMAVVSPDQAPAGGIILPLFVLVVLGGFVVFMAGGFAEREPFLRSWLQDAMAPDPEN
jgi:hypothetical protein